MLAHLVALFSTLLGAGTLFAATPRDEVLRLAPPDAALVLVVQNARDHAGAVAESPFAGWFPTITVGRQFLNSDGFKKAREGATAVLGELGTNPEELLNEVLGDAVAFAYSPAPPNRPRDERSVILIRPRKPEVLVRVLDRLNELQTKSGELKGVARHEYHGATYSERQKPDGSDFYCFRGGVFAFSSSEADVKAVIDREVTAGKGTPELAARLTRLGVAEAFVVVLVNPRSLDSELDAKVSAARANDRAFLERFREVWKATDAAAAYLTLGHGLEAGVAVKFKAGELPAPVRGWLTGAKTPSPLWAAIPDTALLAAAGRFKASELLDGITALLPEDGKKALRATVGDTLGPIVGRDKLPLVLDALGPDWAVWAEPPAGEGFLPTAVLAVRIDDGPKGQDAARSIGRAVEFGFQTFRVAYNAGHADQVELREEKDGDTIITSLVNQTGFPAGFRPTFALKGGHLLLATSPEPIRRFKPPAATAAPGEATILRFSGTAARAYLTTHRKQLAKFLAGVGAGKEPELLQHLGQFATVLEPLDRADVVVGGDASGLRIALRVKFVKPLKK